MINVFEVLFDDDGDNYDEGNDNDDDDDGDDNVLKHVHIPECD